MKKYYFLIVGFLFFGVANAQIVNIPDANFKAKLLAANWNNTIASFQTPALNGAVTSYNKVDVNSDGQIQVSEATAIKYLNISSSMIANLEGITNFINLKYLKCTHNQLVSVDLNNLVSLQTLSFWNNQLTDINVTNLTDLRFLDLDNNLLTNINITNNSKLTTLYCDSNQLLSLNVKNGSDENITFLNNPNLNYICSDESQIVQVQTRINTYGYSLTCHTNSYCTFVPGGDFYTIQGVDKFDVTNDGCDQFDSSYPNMKYNISNGSITGSIVSNFSGNYSIPVQSGTYVITPILENSSYYSVFPVLATVTFPETMSPAIRDFCITANGIHNDLEVVMLPQIDAMPGFDINYKILYKNKGTNSQSGTIELTFDDEISDFVSANPSIINQSLSNLSWDFSNLLPFETREILVTLNLNSPIETPPVTAGYILNYTATISGAVDETPLDNISTVNQTVVNSFDPNDKTCLEGATITPSQVGKYVQYMIRFENTGTANAQNVVIKDMIDTAKFDINSLIPINGSHSFVTRITETNKVEFIFENINLPFDDANNDGYVAFKIKTKPTLVLGDTFSNTASIYFDYNFPIVTNTATTTISNVLANQDFIFANYISINPNPTKESLTINTQDIEVSSISIYNTLGQLVQVITNAKQTKTIDVSELKSGNYFIKVVSDKGMSSSKFIKE